ncbi:DUF6497 family protein [uncultured Lentibacter sp.]|uniref:DUF6497 family protein n=1 Tax=uncultured Lentibacter sp. TaxID=1659309 RepID=UPI00262C4116|nr:DUF6497 family protein [uncultured Lentibacter sp.]
MRKLLSLSALACAGLGLLALPLRATDLPQLPSGLVPQLLEAFVEVKPDGALTYARFRFVVPEIGQAGGADYEGLAQDFSVLCAQYALPRLADQAQRIERIVISYSDRAVEFGQSDPEATQFFEVFSLKDGACIWEEY